MREIKFRAWDKENEIMVFSDKRHHDYWFDIYEDGLFKCLVNCSYCDSFGYEYDSWEPLENLMQYTGIKDKNGKEVYEGDIVEYYSPSYDEYFELEVKYKQCSFFIENYLLYNKRNVIRIIGNIYENPQLLKEYQNGK